MTGGADKGAAETEERTGATTAHTSCRVFKPGKKQQTEAAAEYKRK